jgi:type II secretory pathway component GspD/PulD (secretin)
MFAITGDKLKKVLFRTALCLLIAVFITTQGSFLGISSANAENGSTDENGNAVNTAERLITVNMVNADVRDILSTIALSMDVSIIYLDTPVKISFSAKDVTPEKGLQLLIQSIGTSGGQLGYIRDGKVIIVGSQDKLQKDFLNQMALTRFRVSYISPAVLSEQLEKLSIPVVRITLDKSSKYIWVQGTPQALSKVSSVIAALDIRENFDTVDGTIKSGIDLRPILLKYITAEQIQDLIQQLKIDASTITVDTNPMVLWASGSKQAMVDVGQLVSQVDIPQSKSETFSMSNRKLKYITYNKLITIMNQLSLPVEIIRVGSGQKNLWFKGTQTDLDEMNKLVTNLDIADNSEEVQFFSYSLNNISPADAKERLDFLAVSNVDSMTLNFPGITKEILIKCPYDMIGTVTRILANIDVQGQKIKAPVDYASSSYQLTERKELISKMMDIPMDNLFISDNISRDGGESYYVMWVIDTPNNIKKIQELVKLLDAPLSN